MLVYLGANARHDLVCELLQSNPEIRFVASSLFAEMPSSMLEDRAYQKALVSFDSSLLTESGEIALTPVNDHNMVLIIDNVMSDKLLGLMWTRFGSKIRRRNGNEVKRYEVVYSLVKSALKTCLTFQPKFVLFSYEPHMLPITINPLQSPESATRQTNFPIGICQSV